MAFFPPCRCVETADRLAPTLLLTPLCAGGAATCIACAAGQYAAAGAVKCTMCTAGQYAGAAAPKCDHCAAGKSVDAGKGVQAGDCADCAGGHYAASGTACDACPIGKYVAAGKGTQPGDCTDCPAGKYYGERACRAPCGPRTCRVRPSLCKQLPLTAYSSSACPPADSAIRLPKPPTPAPCPI